MFNVFVPIPGACRGARSERGSSWLLAALVPALLLGACQSKATKKEAPREEVAELPSNPGGAHPPSEIKLPGVEAVPLPGDLTPAPWLADASRVVAIERPGGPWIVAGGNHWLRWFDASGKKVGELEAPGATQILEVFDVDGDGIAEVVVGKGMGRDAADSPMSAQIYYLMDGKGEAVKKPRVESVELPESSRAQVVGIAAVPGHSEEFWIASFVNKFEVEVARYQRQASGTWALQESRGRHRVVGDLTVMPDGTPVIARFYGNSADEDGGVYALPAEGEPVQLPSTRGARAVLALPGPEFRLVMADGWHKEYGKKAKGLITLIAKAEQGYRQVASVEVKGNYGFNQLRLGQLHREPGPEILASGNGSAVVMLPGRPDLLFELAGVEAVDAFPLQLSGDPRMEVVIAGPQPAIWSPR